MIGAVKFLLSFSLLLTAAQCNILKANDVKTCTDLCTSCDGKATFENEICKCLIPEEDAKGLECVKRLKLEAKDLGVESSSDSPETAERSARCSLLGSRKHIAPTDVDRVASYFMGGGPLTGTPLLGSTNTACATSSNDPVTGAVNPGNAKPLAVEPEDEKQVNFPIAKSPVIVAPSHTYASAQHQPIVSSPWVSSADVSYNPMIGAPHSYQSGFYPHMLGPIPHMVMALPNAVMRAASHLPSHHSGIIGAVSHHSPILASLASGTHGVLQRLDKMVSPYVSEKHNNKIVGAPLHKTSDCSRSSQQSNPNSNMVGAPTPVARTQPIEISNTMLQKVLAQQNALLEALSHQLESVGPQVGAPRMQYAPVSPMQYMVGAPQPIGQYMAQAMSQFCPDGSSNPKASESSSKSVADSSKETDIVSASNPNFSSKVENDDLENKKMEESKKLEEGESQKTKRETRTRSSSKKKRGDVKNVKQVETIVPQVKSEKIVP